MLPEIIRSYNRRIASADPVGTSAPFIEILRFFLPNFLPTFLPNYPDVRVGNVSVAHDEKLEGARLVQVVPLHEAAHSLLATVGYVGTHAVEPHTNVPGQHTKNRRRLAGSTFPRIILRKRPKIKE